MRVRHGGVEQTGLHGGLVMNGRRVGQAVAELRGRSGSHLEEHDGRRVPFGCRVVPATSEIVEEPVEVRAAAVPVGELRDEERLVRDRQLAAPVEHHAQERRARAADAEDDHGRSHRGRSLEDQLRKRACKRPFRSQQRDGQWVCPPGAADAARFGHTSRVHGKNAGTFQRWHRDFLAFSADSGRRAQTRENKGLLRAIDTIKARETWEAVV